MANIVDGAAAAASYELALTFTPPPIICRLITGENKLVQFVVGDTAKEVDQKLKELTECRSYRIVFQGAALSPEDIIRRIYEILVTTLLFYVPLV